MLYKLPRTIGWGVLGLFGDDEGRFCLSAPIVKKCQIYTKLNAAKLLCRSFSCWRWLACVVAVLLFTFGAGSNLVLWPQAVQLGTYPVGLQLPVAF